MRILHLDSGEEMRGGQWQVLRLHRGLVTRGIESKLLTPLDSPLMKRARQEGLLCDELRAPRLPLLSRSYDIVHAHDAHSHTMGALLSRVPLAVSRRVAFPVKNSAASRWKYSKAVMFLAVSKFVAQELERSGVPKEKIHVVYDGVPVPAVAAQGRAVLVPHTLDPQKGMSLAIAAATLAEVPVKTSVDWEADLPGAQALVYLTQFEGLGSGILLAMSYGVTVIASNTGGIPELIEDGETGILVPNKLDAVAAAFRRIHPKIGAAGRAKVENHFTEEHMIRSTIDAYRKVLR